MSVIILHIGQQTIEIVDSQEKIDIQKNTSDFFISRSDVLNSKYGRENNKIIYGRIS